MLNPIFSSYLQAGPQRSFPEVGRAKEAKRGLLAIVQFVFAFFSLEDDAVDPVQASVQEVDSLPANCQPSTAADPWAPFSQTREDGIWLVIQFG